MNRRQLIFMIMINALFSLLIALVVAWVVEVRRPDPEELAALATPAPAINLGITAAPQQPGTTGQGAATETAVPVPTAAVATEAAPAGEATEYTVKAGDTLLTIASQFGISVDNIMEANGLDNPDFVFVGQRLIVPVAGGNSATSSTQSQSAPQATPTLPPGEGLQIGDLSGGGDLAAEVLTVVNESNLPYNLRGWSVETAGGPSYNFGELPIFPGASVNLHSGAGADNSVDLYWDLQEPVWVSGVTVRLLDDQDEIIDTYTVP